jgi:predicted ribonuclease YlaK
MIKNYILDTNVLIHDPQSIFQFQDNSLYVPVYVLEELDKIKSEQSLRGRNSREACRIIDEFRCQGSLAGGVDVGDGKFFIYVPKERKPLSVALDTGSVDNAILQSALEIKESTQVRTILVTMDVNLRVRAESIGIQTASYESQSVDPSRMITGQTNISVGYGDIDELYKKGFLNLSDRLIDDTEFYDNICIMMTDPGGKTALGRYRKKERTILPVQIPKDIMGIKPRNKEQQFALDLLLDDNIKLMTLVGMAGTGKAQPLNADVLTPNGYVKMGSLRIGDYVSVPSGGSAQVIGIFPQGKKEVFEVSFSDGTSTIACGDHLWLSRTSVERDQHRPGKVRSTSEIKDSLTYREKKNHSIPMTQAIEMPKRSLVIDPYAFGLLLGDGTFRHHIGFSTADDELSSALDKLLGPQLKLVKRSDYDYDIVGTTRITNGKKIKSITDLVGFVYNSISECVNDGYERTGIYRAIKNKTQHRGLYWEFGEEVTSSDFITYLKSSGLYNKSSYEKFIPNDFKFSSISDRIALLQGLMDTDGSVDKRTGKDFEFTTTSEMLSEDVKWLVQSLGGTVTITSRKTKYTYQEEIREGKDSYRLRLVLPNDINPFRLKRKASLVKPREKYRPTRYIVSVKSCGETECQCILIDHRDHLYLTNDCIVTHNTLLAVAAGLHKLTVDGTYSRLIISRPVVPMGKDIGYLPGSMKEKMDPWMQPIYDNLELLMQTGGGKRKTGMKYEELFQQDMIRVEPLTYIRGRSLPNQYIIIDESQNLSPHEIKTIITRCGEGSKVILTGDPDQIDSPYMDKATCGLSLAVEKLHNNPIVGHLTLTKGERSELANLAATLM